MWFSTSSVALPKDRFIPSGMETFMKLITTMDEPVVAAYYLVVGRSFLVLVGYFLNHITKIYTLPLA